jgi:universal stress protein A
MRYELADRAGKLASLMPFATHILVPTDFSQASELAVDAAAVLAGSLGAKITLVHVHDPEALRAPAAIGFGSEQKEGLVQQIHRAIETGFEELRSGKLAKVAGVETAILEDASAPNAICSHAAKIGADLIIIATHGRTGLTHLLIGSVAERVVRHAPCPVLTLRSQSKD